MKKERNGKNKEENDCIQELSREEKEILKKIEKGENVIEDQKACQDKQIMQDSKYDVYTRMKYEVDPRLGLVYKDFDAISKQRQVALYMVKKIGSNLLHGKSIMNTSLPVTICSTQSLLEKSATTYGFAPLYCEKMYQTHDPIERMKLACAFAIASLHTDLDQKKPFNPILGETFQGKIGELQISCEQTFHHPPISHLYLVGEHYKIYAKHHYVLTTYPNTAILKTIGKRHIIFNDQQSTHYSIDFPVVEVKGGLFGKRILNFVDSIKITDKTNKIYGQIRFKAGEKSFSEGLFKKSKERSDFFKGFITKSKSLLQDNSKKAFYSKEMISYIEGYWIDYLMIDGDKYWEIGKEQPTPLTKATNLLNSDSDYRADLQAMKIGNLEQAQIQKENLEDIQRNEFKLREAYQK